VSTVTVPRYWWRAAEYGLRLRLTQPAFELTRLALGLLGFALASAATATAIATVVRDALALPVVAILPLAVIPLIATGFMLVRYLGNLSRIMGVAAWTHEGAARLRRDMAIGMKNDRAYAQLIELYRPLVDAINSDLKRAGSARRLRPVSMRQIRGGSESAYAAVAIDADEHDSLASLLRFPIGKRNGRDFRDFSETRQRLMRKWREMEPGRPMEDERGDNYCLRAIHLGSAEHSGQLRLETFVATYGEIVRSCDALINEFALYAYLTDAMTKRWRLPAFPRRQLKMSSSAMLRCLPWRHRIHRASRARPRDLRWHRWSNSSRPAPGASLFLRPEDRAAGIGIAVVTLDSKNGEDYVYLGSRSAQVGTYPTTNHVVPAGMCNTYGTHSVREWQRKPPPDDYLKTAMRCEFLEEWFGEKELENNKRRDWNTRVNSRWKKRTSVAPPVGIPDFARLKWPQRKSVIKEGLRLTGIAFDLLNLRPEVCATAMVDTREGELNWEFAEIGIEGPLRMIGEVERTDIVQSGAAALMLAQHAREVNAAEES
jgi:hypothetical protein